jgi:hypothetical protein
MFTDFPWALVEVLADAAPNAIDPLTFEAYMKVEFCFYGKDELNQRYLEQYEECKSKLKVIIVSIVLWEGADQLDRGLNGINRRDDALKSVIRFYAYFGNVSDPLPGSLIVDAVNEAPDEFDTEWFGYILNSAWTVSYRPGNTTTAPPRVSGAAEDSGLDADETLTIIIAVIGGIIVCCLIAIIVCQRRRMARAFDEKGDYFDGKSANDTFVKISGRDGFVAPATEQYDAFDNVAKVLQDHAESARWTSEPADNTNADPAQYDEMSVIGASDVGPYVDYTRSAGVHRRGPSPTPPGSKKVAQVAWEPEIYPDAPPIVPRAPTGQTAAEYDPAYIGGSDVGYVMIEDSDPSPDKIAALAASIKADGGHHAPPVAATRKMTTPAPALSPKTSPGGARSPLARQRASLLRMRELCEQQIKDTAATAPAAVVLKLTRDSITQQLEWIEEEAAAGFPDSAQREQLQLAGDGSAADGTAAPSAHFYPASNSLAY